MMSSDWQLLTDRLRLRPYRADDAAAMFPIFGDPEVMRYSQHGADPLLAATKVRIQKLIDHQAQFGFSLWVVEDRSTGAIVGDCGLKHLEDGPAIEVGYRFELWLFSSDDSSWQELCGRAGIALVRQGRAIDGIVMLTN